MWPFRLVFLSLYTLYTKNTYIIIYIYIYNMLTYCAYSHTTQNTTMFHKLHIFYTIYYTHYTLNTLYTKLSTLYTHTDLMQHVESGCNFPVALPSSSGLAGAGNGASSSNSGTNSSRSGPSVGGTTSVATGLLSRIGSWLGVGGSGHAKWQIALHALHTTCYTCYTLHDLL